MKTSTGVLTSGGKRRSGDWKTATFRKHVDTPKIASQRPCEMPRISGHPNSHDTKHKGEPHGHLHQMAAPLTLSYITPCPSKNSMAKVTRGRTNVARKKWLRRTHEAHWANRRCPWETSCSSWASQRRKSEKKTHRQRKKYTTGNNGPTENDGANLLLTAKTENHSSRLLQPNAERKPPLRAPTRLSVGSKLQITCKFHQDHKVVRVQLKKKGVSVRRDPTPGAARRIAVPNPLMKHWKERSKHTFQH